MMLLILTAKSTLTLMTKYFALICLSLLLFTACEKDKKCSETFIATAQDVTAPTTGSVNEVIPIDVFYGTTNGCQRFNRFITFKQGNETAIALEILDEGCSCTAIASLKKESYEFTAATPGEYVLKIGSATNFTEINLTIV